MTTKANVWPTRRFRHDAIIFLVLFALVMIIWLPRLKGPIDLRWDAGVYYVLGTSLAEGKGYRLLNEPGEIDATQYPPLLPAIVAAHQWILGTSNPLTIGHWLRLSFLIVFIVYIFTAYWMARTQLPLKYAFLAASICLFSLHTYFLSDLCSPEILFGLTTVSFVLCHESKKNKNRWIYPTMATAFAIASYLLRTIGIALLLAWIGESLFNKEFKRVAIRLMLSFIPILCWQSYISLVESGEQYNNPAYEYQRADYLFYNVSYSKNISLKDPFRPELGQASFEDLVYRFMQNLAKIPTSLGESISTDKILWAAQWDRFNKALPYPLETSWPASFVPMSLGCLILGGIGLQLAARQWIIPLYILIYLAGICLTPWPEQLTRYMAPISPFLALSLFKFLITVKDQSCILLDAKWKAVPSIFIRSIFFLVFIQQFLTLSVAYTIWHQRAIYEDDYGKKVEYRLFFYSNSYQALDAGLDWLKKQAKPSDVVAAAMPHWVHLRTGLKAVMPPFEANTVKAQNLIDSVPVSYVILDELRLEGNANRKYAAPLVQNSPDQWKRVYSASVAVSSDEEPKGGLEIYQRMDPKNIHEKGD